MISMLDVISDKIIPLPSPPGCQPTRSMTVPPLQIHHHAGDSQVSFNTSDFRKIPPTPVLEILCAVPQYSPVGGTPQPWPIRTPNA
ncbi:hypothetical protein BJY00DRAFT_34379 [Aspergillus carlsbadensis]|nr:hypothetical protein BJY00DRAFT_34379 [Aspergillus carlsbadensis]